MQLLLFCLLWTTTLVKSYSISTIQPKKKTIIQVCQNKDCCQRFKGKSFNLVQTLEQLTNGHDNVEIQSSGCQSQCGKGPNIYVSSSQGDTRLSQQQQNGVLHGIDSAHAAVVALELHLNDNDDDSSSQDFTIHPTLLAAWNCMEKSNKASTFQEKERYLNSVVSALERMDDLKVTSKSLAHALTLRAQCRLDTIMFDRRMNADEWLEEAKSDALRATQLHPTLAPAWRVLADAHVANHNIPLAIEALQQWGRANPLFTTKIHKEIAQLRMGATA